MSDYLDRALSSDQPAKTKDDSGIEPETAAQTLIDIESPVRIEDRRLRGEESEYPMPTTQLQHVNEISRIPLGPPGLVEGDDVKHERLSP